MQEGHAGILQALNTPRTHPGRRIDAQPRRLPAFCWLGGGACGQSARSWHSEKVSHLGRRAGAQLPQAARARRLGQRRRRQPPPPPRRRLVAGLLRGAVFQGSAAVRAAARLLLLLLLLPICSAVFNVRRRGCRRSCRRSVRRRRRDEQHARRARRQQVRHHCVHAIRLDCARRLQARRSTSEGQRAIRLTFAWVSKLPRISAATASMPYAWIAPAVRGRQAARSKRVWCHRI